ncbi:MAG: general secretion pathway protein GspK [Sedimentisphaerales bacterium]|nr:general secretion pathway protein GspK [Sedimentisphaerales bacterium]
MREGTRQSASVRREEGTVLIVTIWVVLVLAGLALVFARSMRISAAVSANHVASLQAECIANGALEYLVAKLGASTQESGTTSGTTDTYKELQVGQGYFWILRSNLESDREFDYGLTNESNKINLNSASQEMLQRLPGMTAELAASIIDWRDSDSEVTTGGAEDEYYLLQSDAYHCKNAPLETVDEILLIKGASEEMLYGEDTNLNGILDDCENDGDQSDPPDNRNGRLDAGFYDYVTVYSVESNLDSEGNARININSATARSSLQTALQKIVSEDRALEILGQISTMANYSNILDFYFRTGLKAEEFSQIADQLTTSDAQTFSGLVNVNTAPKAVLLCLPGLEESDVEKLLTYRTANSDKLTSIAWVTQVLDQTKAVGIGSYITVRSRQYSADIVCLSGNGRAYKRYKAVIDTQGTAPRVVYWKTLTHFGWPLDPQIVAALRKGEPLTSVVLSMN